MVPHTSYGLPQHVVCSPEGVWLTPPPKKPFHLECICSCEAVRAPAVVCFVSLLAIRMSFVLWGFNGRIFICRADRGMRTIFCALMILHFAVM